MKIPFNEDELKVSEIVTTFRGDAPVYTFPIPPRDAWKLMLEKTPVWMIAGVEQMNFCPDVIPDNKARGFVADVKYAQEDLGGRDMFGLNRDFDLVISGSMIKHGEVLFENANAWEENSHYYAIDGFTIHDDWGTQRAPFFSVEMGEDLLILMERRVHVAWLVDIISRLTPAYREELYRYSREVFYAFR